MFLVSVFDLDGNKVQLNGGTIAYFAPDSSGNGSVVAFAVAGAEGGFATIRVSDTVDQITTQIQAKLRK